MADVIRFSDPADRLRCCGSVGVLDSGVGGLSVLVRLAECMPRRPFLYFADRAWCPYGPRSASSVRDRVGAIVDEMVGLGCRAVVLACNTATSAAVSHLRSYVGVPVVGMEPAVKPAVLSTRTGHIAVLGTQGTLGGGKLRGLEARYGGGVTIHHVVGHGLVELVEDGHFDDDLACGAVGSLLGPLLGGPVDQLVLGCTHYPFLVGALGRVLGAGVSLVDPAGAVARQAARVCGGDGGDGGGVIFSSSGGDLASEVARLARFYGAYRALVGSAWAG